MQENQAAKILIIAGPTASGKSARAVALALARGGEVISVDSRQVYRGLDIGTEKITKEEMQGVPHHLIDIKEPNEPYSAGEFAEDAERLIKEIAARGNLPILAGGTHYYYDALLSDVPRVPPNEALREELEKLSTEELYAQVAAKDSRRAADLDPRNRRRLVRALEIIAAKGKVPERTAPSQEKYAIEWILLEPDQELLRARLTEREESKFPRGLVEEVRRIRDRVGNARLNELGLEYRVVGEYLPYFAKAPQDAARLQAEMLTKLSAQLWQYARRQKAWLRKLRDTYTIPS